MLRLSRPTVALLTTAALLSGVSAWQSCVDDGGRTAPLTALAAWVGEHTSSKRKALDAETIRTRAVTNRMEEITVDVAEGRLSLKEGAARLREACSTLPRFSWDRFRETNQGATDDERFCRSMLKRVALRLGNDSEQSRIVLARLEAELGEQSQ